jgi:uncharacterized membrane protein
MSTLEAYLGAAGYVIETVGVISIIIGFILSVMWFADRLRRGSAIEAYRCLRQDLGRSIMLGLEFLIAGDIIRTIIIEQTLSSAATLAVIVIIRIVLSLTLEFEIEGRWPWKREKT